MLAGTLVWASVAFLQTAAVVGSEVNEIPGTGPDGIADVIPLNGSVTAPTGAAQLQVGVKFARIDVATQFHDDMRVSLAWQNVSGFSQQTQTGGWQLRFGIYYPVRTGSCTGTPDHAVTVSLTTDESYSGSAQTFCAYRDTAAGGSGIVATGDHQGTQLLARDRLVGLLAPKVNQSAGKICTNDAGTTPCQPAGLGSNLRTYFIVGSLLNPGGNTPPGRQSSLTTLELFVRVVRGTA
jgi:hypothetical protein